MRLAVTIVRLLIGAMFLVFGLNGFLHFIPQPEMAGPAAAFMGSLVAGHIMPVVAGFEALIGALLLAGRFVPLALVMLVPILVGIVLYHASFDPVGGVPGYVVSALTAFLLWAYRSHLMPLARPDAQPLVQA